VIHPTHDDSLAANGKKELLEDPYSIPRNLKRFQDIELIIDSLSWMEAQVPALKGRWIAANRNRRTFARRYTAQVIGGATPSRFKEDGGKTTTSYEDSASMRCCCFRRKGMRRRLDRKFVKHFKSRCCVSGTQDKGFKHQEASWRKTV